MGRFISGFATSNNLKSWSDYAKQNSYGDNKAQATDILVPVEDGGLHAAEVDWVPNDGDWQEPQRQSEGRCWSKTMGTGSNEG